jgi:hypothetical protein
MFTSKTGSSSEWKAQTGGLHQIFAYTFDVF